MLDAIISQCSTAHAPVMHHIVQIESAHNPFAIGVVGGKLKRQPVNYEEALVTAQALQRLGRNFSVGASQVNIYNFQKYGLNLESALKPCQNIAAGSKIFKECHDRALSSPYRHASLEAALSCYYTGHLASTVATEYINRFRASAFGERKPQVGKPTIERSTASTHLPANTAINYEPSSTQPAALKPVQLTRQPTASALVF